MGKILSVMMWAFYTVFGLFMLLMIFTFSGTLLPPWLLGDKEISHEKPYADFIGREYRVTGQVTALAWNDFPDKTKILTVSLEPLPAIRNRFVSYSIPLQPDQSIHITSARKHLTLEGFTYYYLVNVPDAGLPDGIPVKMSVGSDGVPSPHLYEAIN